MRLTNLSLFCFTVLLFIRGAIEEYLKVNNFYIDLLLLIIAVSIFCISYCEAKDFHLPYGSFLFIAYILWGFLSMLLTHTPLYFYLNYFRSNIISFLIFLALYNTNFENNEVENYVKLFFYLLVLQIGASLFELFVLGQQAEYRVAFLAFGSGGYATLFPFAAMSFLLGVYFFYKQKIFYYILSWGTMVIGYASGKRAVLLLCPLFYILFLVIYFILIRKNKNKDQKNKKFIRKFIIINAVMVFIFVNAFLFLLSTLKGFEELQLDMSTKDKIAYAQFYISYYTLSDSKEESGTDYTIGRGANNSKILDMIKNGTYREFWFGGGPMSCDKYRKSYMLNKYKIGYGLSGMAYEILSLGVPGALLYILFFFRLYTKFFSCVKFNDLNPIGKSIYFGIAGNLLVFLFIHFYYFNAYIASVLGTFILFSAIAVLTAPNYSDYFYKKREIS